MNNPFLNRLMKDEKEDIIHSSAYARAQGASSMGADSTESFARRQAIDNNRTVVRRFGDSRIANESGVRDMFAKSRVANDRIERSNNEALNGPRRFAEPEAGGRATTNPPARRNPGIFR